LLSEEEEEDGEWTNGEVEFLMGISSSSKDNAILKFSGNNLWEVSLQPLSSSNFPKLAIFKPFLEETGEEGTEEEVSFTSAFGVVGELGTDSGLTVVVLGVSPEFSPFSSFFPFLASRGVLVVVMPTNGELLEWWSLATNQVLNQKEKSLVS
jgi:hypothetical protein